jgi:hypothetical protein
MDRRRGPLISVGAGIPPLPNPQTLIGAKAVASPRPQGREDRCRCQRRSVARWSRQYGFSGPFLTLNRPDRLGHDRHRRIARWDLRGVACVDHLLGFRAYTAGSGLALEPGCHRQGCGDELHLLSPPEPHTLLDAGVAVFPARAPDEELADLLRDSSKIVHARAISAMSRIVPASLRVKPGFLAAEPRSRSKGAP